MVAVLCAPDKFRGSLTAASAAEALAAGARQAGLEAVTHPLADGGEGTLDVLVAARGGRILDVPCRDALGAPATGRIGLLPDGTGVVEAAEAIGLQRIGSAARDPMAAGSAGLGDLLLAALDAGAARLIVGLGGSATVDGGLGALIALGATARDGAGAGLSGSGADTLRIATLDLTGVDARLRSTPLVLALDVQSPLTGRDGAARVFGPQKGATPAQVAQLDDGLTRVGGLLGAEAAGFPGAGAAGGIAAGLAAIGGRPARGADLVLEETGFAGRLHDAALCLTGEGSVDAQTISGKTVERVLKACVAAGVPCAVVGGAVDPAAADALYAAGAAAVVAASPGPGSLEDALAHAGPRVEAAARALCGVLRARLRRRDRPG
jgi:glycerate kinase